MNETRFKEVRFDLYCDLCVNKDLDESLEPCNSCLDCPNNEHSRQPVNYEQIELSDKDAMKFVSKRTGCTTQQAIEALERFSNDLRKAMDYVLENKK